MSRRPSSQDDHTRRYLFCPGVGAAAAGRRQGWVLPKVPYSVFLPIETQVSFSVAWAIEVRQDRRAFTFGRRTQAVLMCMDLENMDLGLTSGGQCCPQREFATDRCPTVARRARVEVRAHDLQFISKTWIALYHSLVHGRTVSKR